jgi:putative membrane protein
MELLEPVLKKNDKRARWLIIIVSAILFLGIVALNKDVMDVAWPFNFDVHVFALLNAIINSSVFVLLLLGFWAVKKRKLLLHKRLMLAAIVLSILFLISYVIHHLFAGDTHFGGVGAIRYVYFFILITHIFLAAVILPFILFTAYRALSGDYERHKKIARYTWPFWLYIALTGVLIYILISPYY